MIWVSWGGDIQVLGVSLTHIIFGRQSRLIWVSFGGKHTSSGGQTGESLIHIILKNLPKMISV